MGSDKRAYTIINLTTIQNNVITLKKLAPTSKILATIKANAYGHGAVEVAKAIENLVDFFGVATVNEGLELRNNGISKAILLLGYIDESNFVDAILNNITITIYNQYIYEKFTNFLECIDKVVSVHIAVDTGMSRLGFAFDNEVDKIIEVCNNKYIAVEGIFTHFACADKINSKYNTIQKRNFNKVIEQLKNNGINIPFIHTDNTAAIINGSNKITNLIRPGIGIYGVNPIKGTKLDLQMALELHTFIADIRLIPKGRGVSYGKTFTAKTCSKIATVAIGYADGLPREMSNKGRVLINGDFAPIVGRVCMDYIMVDISDINCAKIGDRVTIIGQQRDKFITVNEVANICKTITYEIFTQITQRTKKLFVKTDNLK